MDLTYSEQDVAFREEVRTFLRDKLPTDIKEKVLQHKRLEKDDYVRWHLALKEQGWGAPSWPVEYGGTGWNPLQKLIFEVECYTAGAPRLLPFGLTMIGPVLMKYASQAQKDYFLPRIIDMADWWCQGYSEPGAGSDLASLKTRAVREGDHYVVNGQKTWNTLGQHADWIFCLVRTDTESKPQEGISMLLIDMKTPGITVRPIVTLDGGTEINEVWFEDVKVPVENIVGEENKGWTYAKYLLGHERTNIAGLGHCNKELTLLKEQARTVTTADGRPLIESQRIRDRIARVEMDIMALEMLLLRVATASAGANIGSEASILKIRGSEIQQTLAMLQMEVAGPYAWPFSPDWMRADATEAGPGPEFAAASAGGYFDMRKTTIYGGSTEVQKNIIAKMLLGI